MGVFDRLFGRGDANAARKAELSGELRRAVVLWAEAGRPDEAARVMILRGDAELDPRARLQHYTQAVTTAPDGEMRRLARRKRALLTLSLAEDTAVSAAGRADLAEAARELEALGEGAKAADAYALAGDPDGEARALAKSGEVERLEDLLVTQQSKDRSERRRHETHAQIQLLLTSGRRREALQAAKDFAREQPEDRVAQELSHALLARRVSGPVVRITLRGAPLTLVVSNEIIIGRTEGTLTVHSHAISRQHVAIVREGDVVLAKDLGSRNGTLLRGNRLKGAASVGDGLELVLGGEVPLRITPSRAIAGAVDIEIRGERYVAPLGPARLGIGAWRIETANDGWLELVTDDAPTAMLDGIALVGRATLLAGDAIAGARDTEPVLRMPG